jgi:hypothetical protein
MGIEAVQTAAVADDHTFTGDDFADATELYVGKFFFPSVQQLYG